MSQFCKCNISKSIKAKDLKPVLADKVWWVEYLVKLKKKKRCFLSYCPFFELDKRAVFSNPEVVDLISARSKKFFCSFLFVLKYIYRECVGFKYCPSPPPLHIFFKFLNIVQYLFFLYIVQYLLFLVHIHHTPHHPLPPTLRSHPPWNPPPPPPPFIFSLIFSKTSILRSHPPWPPSPITKSSLLHSHLPWPPPPDPPPPYTPWPPPPIEFFFLNFHENFKILHSHPLWPPNPTPPDLTPPPNFSFLIFTKTSLLRSHLPWPPPPTLPPLNFHKNVKILSSHPPFPPPPPLPKYIFFWIFTKTSLLRSHLPLPWLPPPPPPPPPPHTHTPKFNASMLGSHLLGA